MNKFVTDAPLSAFKNKNKIQNSTTCSCYGCCKSFTQKEITEWTDGGETAICPKCGCDMVLPVLYDEKQLKTIHDYWLEIKS